MKSYLTADLNNQAVPSAPKWFALLIIVLRVVCLVRILVDQTDTLIPIVGNTDIINVYIYFSKIVCSTNTR